MPKWNLCLTDSISLFLFSSILLVIDFDLFFFSSGIEFHFRNLNSLLHTELCILIRDFHLRIKHVINYSECASLILVKLNDKVDLFPVILDPSKGTLLNGNVNPEVLPFNVFCFDGYSIRGDDLLAGVFVILVLGIRYFSNRVFVGDFLLMVLDGSDWLLQSQSVPFGGKVDNPQGWADLDRKGNVRDSEVAFTGSLLLSHSLMDINIIDRLSIIRVLTIAIHSF